MRTRQPNLGSGSTPLWKRIARFWSVIGFGFLAYLTFMVPPAVLAEWPFPNSYGLWYLVCGVSATLMALGSSRPKRGLVVVAFLCAGLLLWRVARWPVILGLVIMLLGLVWRSKWRLRAKIQVQ